MHETGRGYKHEPFKYSTVFGDIPKLVVQKQRWNNKGRDQGSRKSQEWKWLLKDEEVQQGGAFRARTQHEHRHWDQRSLMHPGTERKHAIWASWGETVGEEWESRVGQISSVEWPSEEQTLSGARRGNRHWRERRKVQFGTGWGCSFCRKHEVGEWSWQRCFGKISLLEIWRVDGSSGVKVEIGS